MYKLSSVKLKNVKMKIKNFGKNMIRLIGNLGFVKFLKNFLRKLNLVENSFIEI